MDSKIVHRAYLVVTMKQNGTPFPNIVHVDIYSSSAIGLTLHNGFAADVFHMMGDSYHEVQEKMVEYVMTSDWLKWARPWIDPSFEAHRAKYYWQNGLG